MKTEDRPRRGGWIALALLAVAFVLPRPAPADLVRRCHLADLVGQAGTVFHGRCVAREEFPDARPLPYVEYTFEVTDALKGCRDEKGKPRRTVRIRHALDLPARRLADGTIQAPVQFGVTRYAVGDVRVLFLTEESRIGLCAPVGLDQGAFLVREKGSRRAVANRAGNRDLFTGLPEETARRIGAAQLRAARESGADLELGQFLALCRSMEDR